MTKLIKALPFGVTMLALAACSTSEPVRAPAPSPPPAPRPVPTPPPPPAPSSWTQAPVTSGDWSYITNANGSAAYFGPQGRGALFLMTCNKASRVITFTRAGAQSGGTMTIRSTLGVRSLPTSAAAGDVNAASATLSGSDPFLDQMVFSRGRFMVEASGAETIILPTWAEPFRVVEDCRS